MSTILDKDEQTLRGDTTKYADAAKTAHIVLGKDEKITREDVFTTSLVLFWLKVNKANFILTNKRITGYTPNTIGGYVPFGKKEVVQPLKTISSVSSSTKLHLGRLGVGLLIIILALGSVSDAFLGSLFGVQSD